MKNNHIGTSHMHPNDLRSKWALDHLRSYYTFLYIYAFLYNSLCFYTIYLLFGKIFTQN
nr:MAG TPA: hypothetical protein [Caudoviricetes sp.]